MAPKSGDFPLQVAECYAVTQRYSLALQTTAAVLSATGSKGRWKDGQSRTKAVILAHRMSLELGDIESSSKKLSVAIRADPNCESINKAYSSLKKIRKSVKSAKKDLKKTYNKRALEALESALEGSKKYNLETQVLKGKLMLDLCLVMARVRRHEKALIVCNEAIDLTNVTMDGLFMDTGQLASAFIARGESLMADRDYSEAVRDFRRATEIAGECQEFFLL
jgi:tetratricopeptide (TPR) repeat protein